MNNTEYINNYVNEKFSKINEKNCLYSSVVYELQKVNSYTLHKESEIEHTKSIFKQIVTNIINETDKLIDPIYFNVSNSIKDIVELVFDDVFSKLHETKIKEKDHYTNGYNVVDCIDLIHYNKNISKNEIDKRIAYNKANPNMFLYHRYRHNHTNTHTIDNRQQNCVLFVEDYVFEIMCEYVIYRLKNI